MLTYTDFGISLSTIDRDVAVLGPFEALPYYIHTYIGISFM
jgi:hypothetical protein